MARATHNEQVRPKDILKKGYFLIAPLSIGLFPVLSFYVRNIQDVLPELVVEPILIVISLTLLSCLLLWLLVRNPAKVSVITGTGWLFFFFYVPLLNLVSVHVESVNDLDTFLLPAWVAIFVFISVRIWKSDKRYEPALMFLTILGLIGLSFQLAGITRYSTQPTSFNLSKYLINNEDKKLGDTKQEHPDIYYIMLDGYPRSDVLEEYFGFDNSGFDDSLIERKFFIAKNSHTNYSQTALAIPSILNMSYIKDLSEQKGIPLEELIELYNNNKTLHFLKSGGYRWINNNNFYRAGVNHSANINLECGASNEFLKELIGVTVLRPLDLIRNHQRQDLRSDGFCVMENFSANVPGPQFTFSHLLSPHPPYVYGADGEDVSEVNLSLSSADRWLAKEPFVEQLKFINKRVVEEANEILNNSNNSIIVIQSDHGTLSSATEAHTLADTRKVVLKERHRNYLAIHLPDYCNKDLLHDSISGVNTFRIIFNACFGSNYEMLADKIYYNASGPRGYWGFKDITQDLSN